MILYLDTSALVKRYFEEPQSEGLISKWKEAVEIVTSSVAYAETIAAFCRKRREANLEEKVTQEIMDAFRHDWKSFIRVEVTDELNEAVDRVLAEYPLRGFDAIHLASATLVRQSLPENFVFACFDQRLAQAAKADGFEIFPQR
jgi:uncharacterized protein